MGQPVLVPGPGWGGRGGKYQHIKFTGGTSKLIIGDNNIFREHVTIHPGTEIGSKITKIGSNGLFMVGSHVAHDCIISDNIVLATSLRADP